MKYLITIFAIATCAHATPLKSDDRHGGRAMYNYNHFGSKATTEYNSFPSKTTPEYNPFPSKTTPEVIIPLESTTQAKYTISSNRGEMISPESSESFKSIMAFADILKQVFEFVSSVNFSRLFSVEGFRSVSYVLFELAPLVMGPYSGILRVLLSPLLQDTANSMDDSEY